MMKTKAKFFYIFLLILSIAVLLYGCNEALPPMMSSSGVLNSSHIGWTKPNCATCHPYKAIELTANHKALFDAGADGYQFCSVCHGMNGTGGGAEGDNATTPSSCSSCHQVGSTASSFNARFAFTHSAPMQSDNAKCSLCHNTSGHPGGSSLIATLDCLACHDKTGALFPYRHGVRSAGRCEVCHVVAGFNRAYGYIAHKINFIASTNCVSCHNESSAKADIMVNAYFKVTHTASLKKLNDDGCKNCHVVDSHPVRATTFKTLTSEQCNICHTDPKVAGGDHGDGPDCIRCHNFSGFIRTTDKAIIRGRHTNN